MAAAKLLRFTEQQQAALERMLADYERGVLRGGGGRRRVAVTDGSGRRPSVWVRLTSASGSGFAFSELRWDAAGGAWAVKSDGLTSEQLGNVVDPSGTAGVGDDVLITLSVNENGERVWVVVAGSDGAAGGGSEPGAGDCDAICTSGTFEVPGDAMFNDLLLVVDQDFRGRMVHGFVAPCNAFDATDTPGSGDTWVLPQGATGQGNLTGICSVDVATAQQGRLVVDFDDGGKLKFRVQLSNTGASSWFVYEVRATTQLLECPCVTCGVSTFDLITPADVDVRVTYLDCEYATGAVFDYATGNFHEITGVTALAGSSRVEFGGTGGNSYAYDPATCRQACLDNADSDLTLTGSGTLTLTAAYNCDDDTWEIVASNGSNVPTEKITAANGWTVTQSDSTGLRATKTQFDPATDGYQLYWCIEIDVNNNGACISAP